MNIEIPAAFTAERQRQISEEGYSAGHDDEHADGELFVAAVTYWQRAIGIAHAMRRSEDGFNVPVQWPWAGGWWKPKTVERDLERAGALCLAEIDRLYRVHRPAVHVDAVLESIARAYLALRAG